MTVNENPGGAYGVFTLYKGYYLRAGTLPVGEYAHTSHSPFNCTFGGRYVHASQFVISRSSPPAVFPQDRALAPVMTIEWQR
jgi:hypothetical protein